MKTIKDRQTRKRKIQNPTFLGLTRFNLFWIPLGDQLLSIDDHLKFKPEQNLALDQCENLKMINKIIEVTVIIIVG